MIEAPANQQAILFKLGVAVHAKYPSESLDLLNKPLQEIADFLNEKEGVELEKGASMEYVNAVAEQLLGDDNAVES